MTEGQICAEAEALDNAERSRQQMRQTTEVYPEATIDDAYAIQAHWQQLRLDRGELLIGHKIGLTSRAMQTAMQITTPDSGFITDAMNYTSSSGPATIEAYHHLDLKLEVELAFVLNAHLDSEEVELSDVIAATEYVIPAVELIAARTYRADPATGRRRTVVDTIADNAANAGIITGGLAVGPEEVDLRWVGALLERNGEIEETGLAAAVLNHPANGIVWLARRYAQQGMVLNAGDIVLAGSFTRPVDCRAGDSFRVDYGPLGLLEVEVI
ncbi:MAG: 2-oxo-hepta-3-ene-1,7-dioic acid hydratase [Acidimicrobiales bacterium]|nr:2-oxo-hepta-3-ene-1,7-dioic acid hydratase [Acidimicrobiales bacterium]